MSGEGDPGAKSDEQPQVPAKREEIFVAPLSESAIVEARRLNDMYLLGQARVFGFQLPLDPSRVNGVACAVTDEPRREDFPDNVQFEQARSDMADALASQEKHALAGANNFG